MIRFIHAADVHLDSLMQGLSTKATEVNAEVFRQSTRTALRNLVNWANEEQVDFVTLGGDNYDGNWQNFKTGLFFAEQMAKLDKIPVVSITGNHDAQNKMTRSLRMPPNFKMLKVDEPETYEVMDNVLVIGQGFAEQSETRNLAAGFPKLDGRGIRIGLLHTSLSGGKQDGHDNYAPCSVDELQRKNYHFWGLGHIHKHSWQQLGQSDTPVLYPGNLQGRHIRETGPKGAWLITLNEDGQMIDRQFKALDETRWEHIELKASEISHLGDFWDASRRKLEQCMRQSEGRTLAVRVTVHGQTPLHTRLISLREGRSGDDELLTEMQNTANQINSGIIWVEGVQLRTTATQHESMNTEAMNVLEQFIATQANGDEWLDEFLESNEMKSLRKQMDLFRDGEFAKSLHMEFDKEQLRQLMQEIPEILEAKLNQTDENN